MVRKKFKNLAMPCPPQQELCSFQGFKFPDSLANTFHPAIPSPVAPTS